MQVTLANTNNSDKLNLKLQSMLHTIDDNSSVLQSLHDKKPQQQRHDKKPQQQ